MMFMGLLNLNISVKRLRTLIEQHEAGRGGLIALVEDARNSRTTAIATIGEELAQLDSFSKRLET